MISSTTSLHVPLTTPATAATTCNGLVPSEIVVIVGTALGAVLVSTPAHVLKHTADRLQLSIKPCPFDKKLYLDSLRLLYELFQTARKDGLVAIESHIEKPHDSTMFKKYPAVLHEHHAMDFLCDSRRLVLEAPAESDAVPDEDETSSRNRILKATAEVLGRNGQTKLSLSEVALQAGVSRPTLYRWFASKEDLLRAFSEYERHMFDSGISRATAAAAVRWA